jgi:hypothetical protein
LVLLALAAAVQWDGRLIAVERVAADLVDPYSDAAVPVDVVVAAFAWSTAPSEVAKAFVLESLGLPSFGTVAASWQD